MREFPLQKSVLLVDGQVGEFLRDERGFPKGSHVFLLGLFRGGSLLEEELRVVGTERFLEGGTCRRARRRDFAAGYVEFEGFRLSFY